MDVSVLIPAYNEEQAILQTLKQLNEVLKRTPLSYEIIVIDDGSTDQTKEVLQKRTKGIRVIRNPYNLGYGASLKRGLEIAKGEYVLITDADGTYPIKEIPALIAYMYDYDMVVGARVKNPHIPLLRRPAKWILTSLASILAGRPIPDINSGLRIFKRDLALRFMHLYPNGFSFTTTITLSFFTHGFTVKYVPVHYFKRKGSSSIRPIRDFIGFTTLIVRIMTYFEPLKFFLFPGLLLMLAGFLYGFYQFIVIDNLADLAVTLFLTGLQICFLGLVADLIVKRRG
ncbi:glycosyltransferase [Candidatus Woesearchaeota archaeon]|nr:hypothetical protein [uncultured archaeon]MBS3142085.1 glycosyltransferase [Candidatus Woesearchaeota archaeon]